MVNNLTNKFTIYSSSPNVPNQRQTNGDLQKKAGNDQREAGRKVRLVVLVLQQISHLIDVGREQSQVHHALCQALLLDVARVVGR